MLSVAKQSASDKNLTPSSELEDFCKKLSQTGKPALLSLIPGNCIAYVQMYDKGTLPKPLTDYF